MTKKDYEKKQIESMRRAVVEIKSKIEMCDNSEAYDINFMKTAIAFNTGILFECLNNLEDSDELF